MCRHCLDRAREHVEGLVPLTTLKLVYETQTDETKCIELLLSTDVLKELLTKAEKVHQKLTIMRDFFDQSNSRIASYCCLKNERKSGLP